jgi:hypothetical protein
MNQLRALMMARSHLSKNGSTPSTEISQVGQREKRLPTSRDVDCPSTDRESSIVPNTCGDPDSQKSAITGALLLVAASKTAPKYYVHRRDIADVNVGHGTCLSGTLGLANDGRASKQAPPLA